MTLGHVHGLTVITSGMNQGNDLDSDVPASRITMEACKGAAGLLCANVLATGFQITLLTVATSGALLLATAYTTLAVISKVFDYLRVNESTGRNLSELTFVLLISFFSTAALSKQFGLNYSLGEFFNVSFTAFVGAVGIRFAAIVVMRIYHLLFAKRSTSDYGPVVLLGAS